MRGRGRVSYKHFVRVLTIEMLMFLALYVVAVRCDLETEITNNNETGLLVNHLRRRLMRDNYDYQSSESDEPPTPALHRGEPDDGTSETSPKGSHHDHVNNLFVPRAREGEGEGGGATHAISEKDLLYYVDDDKLAARRAPDLDYSAELNSTTATTPRAKYKLYKIRNKERHRRGGGVTSYRRFIAEKSVSGVAFMPLEPGPLPQFRLPRARRQYMHHHRHHNRHSTTSNHSTRIKN